MLNTYMYTYVHVYLYNRCVGIQRHRHGGTYPMYHSEDLEVAQWSLIIVHLHSEA